MQKLLNLRKRLPLYLQLVRWDRPAGWLLLLWPTLSALWIAAQGFPGWYLLTVLPVTVTDAVPPTLVLRTSMALPSWQPSPLAPCCRPVTVLSVIEPAAPSRRMPARLFGKASQAVARLLAVTVR